MYCTKKISDDLTWVGADDRRLAMFEGVYSVPDGVSYNSYLLTDEKTVLFDTVDKAVAKTFFENVEHALGGRKLDYLVVQHMEPDHSATIEGLLLRHPETTVVCNDKIKKMIGQFFRDVYKRQASRCASCVKRSSKACTGSERQMPGGRRAGRVFVPRVPGAGPFYPHGIPAFLL